jgi:putative transposase
MPKGLVRFQNTGSFHLVTFSCFHRLPYLSTPSARRLFEHSLETMRVRYDFVVCGYVVMPEHVHLLASEPESESCPKRFKLSNCPYPFSSANAPFGHLFCIRARL